jgi:molybdopterin converting factor subunit 1
MRVLVRLFASYREVAGRARLELEVPEGSRVRDVVGRVLEEHPSLRSGRQILYARNRDYVSSDTPLTDGDELALIPPVAGGSVTRPLADVAVTAEPLSVDEALARVRHDDAGAVCVFVGTVRRSNRGKRVSLLEYEAYAEMAETEMAEIARDAEQRFGPLRMAMHHRVGSLRVGEPAVVIATSAPHRDAAFAACRFAIDRLKSVVPIWKKEHTDDGAIWIEEHA